MTPPDATLIEPRAPHGSPPAAPRPRGPLSTARKYAKIFRVTRGERLTYRGDVLFSTFLRFLPMLTTILLWKAIFAGSGDKPMHGFTYEQTIAYLLMVNISRMFSSMPGLAGGIARDVREGTLKKYLLQPLDMIGYLLAYRVAHKVSYIVSSAIPYGVLFLICHRFFAGSVPTDLLTWAAYAAALILSFLVGFFFETAVGMAGFWLLEVTSLLYIVMTMNFFVSGHMFPLDFLGRRAWVLEALPFQYLAYFPAVVFLGKKKGPDLAFGLLGELAWVVFFALLSRWLYRRGLRRYGAYGG